MTSYVLFNYCWSMIQVYRWPCLAKKDNQEESFSSMVCFFQDVCVKQGWGWEGGREFGFYGRKHQKGPKKDIIPQGLRLSCQQAGFSKGPGI